ncbi:carbohydrate esterase family 5 protein [Karstenula rhodostoma CBS 690.94]|uniref:cutinase n=1 Tax=Karstenula rhodostoma CBS 690.94 TaxID=1392251 RepID=A0A9P4PLE3_9PLEO|nr:carbohydrate esterase family 5 protein [Karstenula rhodostoma CBS 690.94]
MATILTQMATQCPDSVILAGGYSQGAAVSHRAIESLDPAVQSQIAGVILYGDTQNTQDKGQIPGFDPKKTKIICAPGDLVCTGSLVILAPHLSYGANAADGSAFLVQKAQAAMAAKKAKRAEMAAKREAGDLAKKMAKVAVGMVA